jgi:hypothetical protein
MVDASLANILRAECDAVHRCVVKQVEMCIEEGRKGGHHALLIVDCSEDPSMATTSSGL